MILDIMIPEGIPAFVGGVINQVHVCQGSIIFSGDPIMDISIDMSGGLSFDCPPRAYYRLIANEPGTVCEIFVEPGQSLVPGIVLGELQVAGSERTGAARICAASIISEKEWWDD